eukprot:354551-Chlamydomonas_euryale.AAC.15
MSQSVGSSSINGVETKSVSLLFPVRSSSGAGGTARVSAREAPRSPRALDVSVQLPDGSVVPIDTRGGGRSAAGATIDVDFTEVRRKVAFTLYASQLAVWLNIDPAPMIAVGCAADRMGCAADRMGYDRPCLGRRGSTYVLLAAYMFSNGAARR